jgi:endonuclease YncB( thermonuclease family)
VVKCDVTTYSATRTSDTANRDCCCDRLCRDSRKFAEPGRIAKGVSFAARVTHVIDGDTVDVAMDRNGQICIRLEGIDCREANQPFGRVAMNFTRQLTFDQVVIVKVADDWEQIYRHPVYCLETFVDPERHRGMCYRAANWVVMGWTTGPGKNCPTKRPNRGRRPHVI